MQLVVGNLVGLPHQGLLGDLGHVDMEVRLALGPVPELLELRQHELLGREHVLLLLLVQPVGAC
eukprot:4289613-Lingulodinium_polyedra.AAC.1